MPNCALLHNHLCMGTDNKWRVCCKFQGEPRPNISSMTHDQFKFHPDYLDVVNKMEDGWHPGCRICKETEEDGRFPSLRQTSNEMFSQDEGLESIELSLSNFCNLKCRMCGPLYSTKWVDLIKNNPEIAETQEFDPYDEEQVNRTYTVKQLLGDKDLSRVKMVKYLGGEPFVTNEIKDLFELLDNERGLENIDFQTNTNCTFFPEKLVPYLSKFKRIVITLSIDGFGNLNEYIRDGKPWTLVASTLEKWLDYRKQHNNIVLLLVPSVQAYNIHNISKLKQYANSINVKFKMQYVRDPEHFSINALPPEYLDSIKDDVNKVDIEKAVFDPVQFEKFVKYTKMLDKANKKNIIDYIPGLEKYVS